MDARGQYRTRMVLSTVALVVVATAMAGCGGSTGSSGTSGMGGGTGQAAGGQQATGAPANGAGTDMNCDKMLQVVFTEKISPGLPDKYFFNPTTATIKKGEYISFQDKTDEVHTLIATPDAGLKNSTIDKGESQPVQFTKAGTFTVESKNAQHRGAMQVTVTDEEGTTCGMKAPAVTVNITEKASPGTPDQYSFTPTTATIKAGDSLAVVNKTDENHTLTCTPDPGIDSGSLIVDKKEDQVLNFAKAGTYACASVEHPDAKITITVQ